ncbi:hypothetical protein EMIT0194P_20341 [Pseudomonas serbica]
MDMQAMNTTPAENEWVVAPTPAGELIHAGCNKSPACRARTQKSE